MAPCIQSCCCSQHSKKSLIWYVANQTGQVHSNLPNEHEETIAYISWCMHILLVRQLSEPQRKLCRGISTLCLCFSLYWRWSVTHFCFTVHCDRSRCTQCMQSCHGICHVHITLCICSVHSVCTHMNRRCLAPPKQLCYAQQCTWSWVTHCKHEVFETTDRFPGNTRRCYCLHRNKPDTGQQRACDVDSPYSRFSQTTAGGHKVCI